MEKLNAHKKIEKARVGLYLDAPFWTTTLFKLPMIEDKEGTITPKYATDGKAIYFNPKFADTLTLEETKGILAHETGHVILLHPFRRGTRELRKWNFACDYSLNQILIDAGFKLPKDGLIDPQYKGMDAEKIYTLIPDPPEGEPQPAGEVLDHPAKSEPEKKQAELEQRLYNVQAGQIAKKQGNLPNGMERLIDDLTAPKINIKEVIGRFVEQTSKNDYTWTAPNRRYLGHELYLPSLKSPELGHIAFLVDISGSVSDEQAKDLLAVIKGTIEVYRNAELSLIYFATSASQPLTITDETEIQNIKTPQVGSGTNYRPPFEMLKTANLDPIGIIVLTDGYCHSFPDREPDAPVLWILTGRNESFKPPFGEVYLLEMGVS